MLLEKGEYRGIFPLWMLLWRKGYRGITVGVTLGGRAVDLLAVEGTGAYSHCGCYWRGVQEHRYERYWRRGRYVAYSHCGCYREGV